MTGNDGEKRIFRLRRVRRRQFENLVTESTYLLFLDDAELRRQPLIDPDGGRGILNQLRDIFATVLLRSLKDINEKSKVGITIDSNRLEYQITIPIQHVSKTFCRQDHRVRSDVYPIQPLPRSHSW